MRATYIKRRIAALLIVFAGLFGSVKAIQLVVSEPPLNCGIKYVKVLRVELPNGSSHTENWWHIAQRMCKNEQRRLGEVVFWMQQVNLYDTPRLGQYVMLPHGEE